MHQTSQDHSEHAAAPELVDNAVAAPTPADRDGGSAGVTGANGASPSGVVPLGPDGAGEGATSEGVIGDAMFSTPAPAVNPSRRPGKDRQRGQKRSARGRGSKEAFWVRLALPDGTSQFFPATDHIGRQMPFTSPKETCAMRVYPEVVCFSLLHLTKRAAKELRNRPITMPHAPLSRLARRAGELAPEPGTLVVEHRLGAGDQTVDRSVVLALRVSGAKVASLESDDPLGDEAFELSPRGERISVFLTSPTVGRRVALGYIGHLGRPGAPDTLVRCAAKVLNAAAALPEFALLTGIEAADVPSLPGGLSAIRPQMTTAGVDIPVRLFSAEVPPEEVGAGSMRLEVDLEHANTSTDRLLFSLTPDANLEGVFDRYRNVAERWASGRLAELLGDEAQMIIYDIVLGEVTDDTVARINEKLVHIGRVDFTPTQFRNPDTV